jgi:sugar phosphate isomerase/epimerase
MKFGICSEIFKDWEDIHRACSFVKEVGYDGIEIAPFTFAPYVTDIDAATRADIVKAAEAVDLDILGIHWVLIGPEGLHLTSPDKPTRDRTAQYLRDLAHFCGDIGGKVIIFGSPKQRNVMDGVTLEQATDNAVEVFESALPVMEERGVTICMEPLSTNETNFCYTAAQTVALIERIGHPNFRLLLDTKAMTDDEDTRPNLIRKYIKHLAHYHANDANLEGPGFGDVDFAPIFEALKDAGYQDYVSVEVFKFDPGPERIARESLAYMKQFV